MTISKKQPPLDPTSVRFGQRIPLELPVRLSASGRLLGQGVIRNASISGALIECALELPLQTDLVVTLSVPGDAAHATRDLNACIVRLDPDGFGVEWRDAATVDITDLLARASGEGPTR